MKKLPIIIILLITTVTSFCQVTDNPTYRSSNLKNQKLEKVEITNTETILFFNFHGNYWQGRFDIMENATLTTNTGQVLNLIRCQNLTKYSGFYGGRAGTYVWEAVFPKITPNTTTLDFESIVPTEALLTGDSYSMKGIKLNVNVPDNTPISNITTNANTNPAPANSSVADEIMKWKKLLDAGAITKQEYDAQKQKLLNTK